MALGRLLDGPLGLSEERLVAHATAMYPVVYRDPLTLTMTHLLLEGRHDAASATRGTKTETFRTMGLLHE